MECVFLTLPSARHVRCYPELLRPVATGIFYDDDWAESDVSDKDIAIQGKMILQGLSRAVDGLGASMMTLPLAAGLTGLFILYQSVFFPLGRGQTLPNSTVSTQQALQLHSDPSFAMVGKVRTSNPSEPSYRDAACRLLI